MRRVVLVAGAALFAAVVLMLALTAGPARAGVRLDPGGAIIFVSSESRAGNVVDLKTASAPGLGDWHGTVNSVASSDDAYASGQFTLLTGFTPDILHCGANGLGIMSGKVPPSAGSVHGLPFRLLRASERARKRDKPHKEVGPVLRY